MSAEGRQIGSNPIRSDYISGSSIAFTFVSDLFLETKGEATRQGKAVKI